MNVIQKQQTEKIEEHKKSSSIENTRLQQRKSQNAQYVVTETSTIEDRGQTYPPVQGSKQNPINPQFQYTRMSKN